MPKLAQRMARAKPSAIMIIAEKARQLRDEGHDVVNFSIGVPNFLPGQHVYDAVRDALAKDSGQYGPNRGRADLLDAFLAHIAKAGFVGYSREHLSTGIGAKHVLYNLAEALLDEGDEFAFPTPYWTSYMDVAEIVGAKVKLLPCPSSQNYKLTPAQLDAALTPKTKLFFFNNPSNPTGMVYTRDEIAALADVLVNKPDTWIVTDDIYHRMVFDGIGYHNFMHLRPELSERVIFVDSLSKTYGMPGWRVGFMAGPVEVANAVTVLNSNHISCIPEITTVAAVAALTGPQDVPEAKAREFALRRDQVLTTLNAIPGLSCPRPQGAFYAFPDISCTFGKRYQGRVIENDIDFCTVLLESKTVVCVPGSAFGEPRAFRISYTCAEEQLASGLQRISDFITELR